jgi:AcrR family transcriptional regulator
VSESISRSDRKRAERIALLERVAARLFAEHGFDATSFDDVAYAVDLRGPSLYHYFTSKEELFLGCIRRSATEVFDRLQLITSDETHGGDARAALRAVFREQVLIEVRDYPEFVPLFFRLIVTAPALQEEVLQIRRRHAAFFEHLTQQALGSTLPLSSDERVRLEIAFGALSYLPSWYRADGRLPPEELAEAMADHLMAVVMTDPLP